MPATRVPTINSIMEKIATAVKEFANGAPPLDMQAFRVAELYYVLGASQGEIARELDLSPSSVSRLLDHARRHRLVQFLVTPPLHAQLIQLLLAALQQRNLSSIRRVLVADGAGRALVGYAAARHFEATAPANTTLVLDGGWTVRDFVTALAPQGRRRVTIIPIAADPPSYKISAFEMATLLAAKTVMHNLQRVPHLVHLKPRSPFLRRKHAEIAGIAKQANVVVLGIGPWQKHFTALEFVQDLGLHPEALKRKPQYRNVVAVCGYFPLTGAGEHVRVKEIAVVLPHALTFDALGAVARHRDNQVLLLAASAEKAAPVLAAIRAGMCNTLVLDKPLAVALLDLLERESAEPL